VLHAECGAALIRMHLLGNIASSPEEGCE
jgi:hypothetical protein